MKTIMAHVRMKKRGCKVSITGSKRGDSWTGDCVIRYRVRIGKIMWHRIRIASEWKMNANGTLVFEKGIIIVPRARNVLKEAAEDLIRSG